MSWVRTSRRTPCPICERPDWCSIATEGDLIVCVRTESPYPCKGAMGGWYHGADAERMFDPNKDRRDHTRKRARISKPKPDRPRSDFAKLAVEFTEQVTDLSVLAKSLGVSVRSLERLDVGWAGKGYSFPMRDGHEKIVGVRIRGTRGKWCIPGSRNGLFWPADVYRGSEYPLVICEGESDCAALLDLGFDAIGRPSCMGGVDHVAEFLAGRSRDVVIIADKDEPKARPDGSTWRPGLDGAKRLASEIKPLRKTIKIVKPPFHKDVRAWLQAGVTRTVIEAVIANTRYAK